jgi:hypothetical protein
MSFGIVARRRLALPFSCGVRIGPAGNRGLAGVGRAHMGEVLYMAPASAVRWNPACKAL